MSWTLIVQVRTTELKPALLILFWIEIICFNAFNALLRISELRNLDSQKCIAPFNAFNPLLRIWTRFLNNCIIEDIAELPLLGKYRQWDYSPYLQWKQVRLLKCIERLRSLQDGGLGTFALAAVGFIKLFLKTSLKSKESWAILKA